MLATWVNSGALAHSLKDRLFNFYHKFPPPFGNPNLYLVNRVKSFPSMKWHRVAQTGMEISGWG